MKVRELISLHDKTSISQENWAFSIYDTTGMIQYGYINGYYSIDRVHPAILNCEVKGYTMGYTSLSLRIDPLIEAEYQSEERCKIDGYEHIDLKVFNSYIDANDNNLFVKDCGNNTWSFAKIVGF